MKTLFFQKVKIVVENCLMGLYGLLNDVAGTMCLLTLLVVTILCATKHLGDIAAAASFSSLPAIIAMIKHKSFNGSNIDQPPPTIQDTLIAVKTEVLSGLPAKGQ